MSGRFLFALKWAWAGLAAVVGMCAIMKLVIAIIGTSDTALTLLCGSIIFIAAFITAWTYPGAPR